MSQLLVSVLITGLFRTFDKCFPSIYENVISKNNCVVFFLIDGVWGPKIIWDFINKYPNMKIGWVLSQESYSSDVSFKAILDMIKNSDRPALQIEKFANALNSPNNNINWIEKGPDFIFKSSGSIIQWYQLWLLWQKVLYYENVNNVKFDQCIKLRTDILIGQPIIVNDEYFIHNNPFIKNIENQLTCSTIDEDCSLELIDKYNNDKIISLAVDIVIIAKRHIFQLMTNMIFHYGLYDDNSYFVFSSETCFKLFCKNNNIKQFMITDKNFPLYTYDINDKDKYLMIILRN